MELLIVRNKQTKLQQDLHNIFAAIGPLGLSPRGYILGLWMDTWRDARSGFIEIAAANFGVSSFT